MFKKIKQPCHAFATHTATPTMHKYLVVFQLGLNEADKVGHLLAGKIQTQQGCLAFAFLLIRSPHNFALKVIEQRKVNRPGYAPMVVLTLASYIECKMPLRLL